MDANLRPLRRLPCKDDVKGESAVFTSCLDFYHPRIPRETLLRTKAAICVFEATSAFIYRIYLLFDFFFNVFFLFLTFFWIPTLIINHLSILNLTFCFTKRLRPNGFEAQAYHTMNVCI